MIACCVRAGEAEEASALLQQMRGRGITPDTICFNMVIGALARSGARQAAEETLQHLLDDGVKVGSPPIAMSNRGRWIGGGHPPSADGSGVGIPHMPMGRGSTCAVGGSVMMVG
eukprot:6671270-Prymnesium_polylepis.2